MNTNKMRDTYEAWAIQDAASVGRELIIDREGDWYIGKDAQFLNLGWASWQASREAVVVEIEQIRSEAKRQEDGLKEMLRRQNKQICALRGRP